MSERTEMRTRSALATPLLALGIAAGLHAATTGALAEPRALAEAVAAWLATLDVDQRDEATYAFTDDERFDLRLAPIGLEGLRRGAMNEAQWGAWRAALAAALSESGLHKVETIMSLEREVRRRDSERFLGGFFGGFVHGEERYFASVYGAPAEGAPFGLRFDGHHLSLNWTVPREGRLSVTPLFLGAEPREVPAGWERAGLRALAAEEDAGVALWRALDAGQREVAELPFSFARGIAGGDRALFLGEGARVEPPEPQGIARAALDPAQAALLDALIDTYLASFDAAIAAERRAVIDAAGREKIHFAWSGNLEPGHAGYYRVQGPTFLIEFDNTLEEADHVHAVLREWEGDFGRDLLAEHYAREHTQQVRAAPLGPRPLVGSGDESSRLAR